MSSCYTCANRQWSRGEFICVIADKFVRVLAASFGEADARDILRTKCCAEWRQRCAAKPRKR